MNPPKWLLKLLDKLPRLIARLNQREIEWRRRRLERKLLRKNAALIMRAARTLKASEQYDAERDKAREAGRLDRLKNPSKYRGKD